MTRAERLAIAPREPRAAEVQYLRLAGQFAKLFEAKFRETFPELSPGRADRVADPIRSPAVFRTDVLPCGCAMRPTWYRMDALSEFSARWGILSLELDGEIDAMGSRMADVWQTTETHNRKEMSRILHLDIQAQDRNQAQRFVRENIQLVKSVKSHQLARLERLVSEVGQEQGRVEGLAGAILEQFSVTKSRAELIARDQVLRLNSQLAQSRQIQAGVTGYIWTTSRDTRVRQAHKDLDGRRCSWMIAPVVDPKTGRQAHPGGDFQCRCVAVPDTDDLLFAE